MESPLKTLLSIIVPVYNEENNIPVFFATLSRVLAQVSGQYRWEIIFVNDGSRDNSARELANIASSNGATGEMGINVLEFSSNFGKEAALTAGLNEAQGAAAIMIDADLQHPPELIPDFIKKWEEGAEVVIGLRDKNKAGWLKRAGSWLFYSIIRRISNVGLRAGETDFRLVDRQVIEAFRTLTERRRMVRALIDWLGFQQEYIVFEGAERLGGRAGYGFKKLISLAVNSFVALSLVPLKLAGYLGLIIIFTAGPLGLYILIGKYFLGWAFASSFSGPAQLAILITFLVGIVLSSLGLVALYIAHIHSEVLGRPLYVIRKKTGERLS